MERSEILSGEYKYTVQAYSALIDYIENEAEIAMPINELMHEEGRHLTKKEYGEVLLKYLVKELRARFIATPTETKTTGPRKGTPN